MIEQSPSPLAAALAALLPAQHLLADEAGRARYAIHGVVPRLVAAPGSLEELAAVLGAAHAARAVVAPWGGGTQQLLGTPPGQVDLVVRTERLNRVLIHEPDDLTISVEAGITVGALREHLAQHGQMLPLDPALPARSTIGGLLATAADGPRRLGYGTARDLLIGTAVVEANGRVSRAGGMVVKNVSGFDMMKLYNGSLGSLAVIASANFKLLPAPRRAATCACVFANSAAAFGFVDTLHATQLTPTAVEYLDRQALVALEWAGTCAVFVRAEGLDAAVERHMRDVAQLAQQHAAATQRIDDDAPLWDRIANLVQIAELAPDEAVVKFTLLPGDAARAIAQLEALPGMRPPQITARAANGVIYARLRGTNAAQLLSVAALPGLRWIATPIADAPRWGALPSGIATMRRIKHEFDPQRLLNTGRFLAE